MSRFRKSRFATGMVSVFLLGAAALFALHVLPLDGVPASLLDYRRTFFRLTWPWGWFIHPGPDPVWLRYGVAWLEVLANAAAIFFGLGALAGASEEPPVPGTPRSFGALRAARGTDGTDARGESVDKLYPRGPANPPPELCRPTGGYRLRAWLAVASLALFLLLYLALSSWFAWTAYRILHGAQESWDFVVGGSAAFLALFMIKALFFVQHRATSDSLEVTAQDQPRLFEFLHRLADEAGAPRPKRVFVAARVNACVFYDFSVLNLLFPSKKNLEIGLPLVNVLTLSELKAVLAHEFGHFAQRSMAIGSWVYIAQQIAGQVIARRDALDKFLNFVCNIDLRVAWIGWLVSLVVWSIRALTDTVFRLVVLAQRGLSRQMEFQADLVAVSLTGSDELVHALHKLQAAEESWQRTLSFAGSEFRNGRLTRDLFAVQSWIIGKMGEILCDDLYGRVPPLPAERPEAHRLFRNSFAQPPQMWATHPSSADREDNAKRRYVPAARDSRSAWELFDDVAMLKEIVVEPLFPAVEEKPEPASPEATAAALGASYALAFLDPCYRGVYLGRSPVRHVPTPPDLYDLPLAASEIRPVLATLYPAEVRAQLGTLRDLEEELASLQALRDRQYRATGGRLVYRGREISRRELPAVIEQVRSEVERGRADLLDHDRRCRAAHLAAADQLGGGWRDYLVGLIEVLHYAEHTKADILDANGVLNNTYAVVTADGKVSGKELKRLIASAQSLYQVLQAAYDQALAVELDATLCERLDIESWAGAVEEFKLQPPDQANISSWLGVIGGWIDSLCRPLSALASTVLEQLLITEGEIARHIAASSDAGPAPAPSRVPRQYPVLVPGQERKRQTRLGLWDRFQTADGLVPAIMRLAVAGCIVGSVLYYGSVGPAGFL